MFDSNQYATCILATLSLRQIFYLLLTFANRLDPDQDHQKFSPGQDQNCLTARHTIKNNRFVNLNISQCNNRKIEEEKPMRIALCYTEKKNDTFGDSTALVVSGVNYTTL